MYVCTMCVCVCVFVCVLHTHTHAHTHTHTHPRWAPATDSCSMVSAPLPAAKNKFSKVSALVLKVTKQRNVQK